MAKSKKTYKGVPRSDIGVFLVDQMSDFYDTAFDHMNVSIEDEEQFNADFDATLDYLRKQLKEVSK